MIPASSFFNAVLPSSDGGVPGAAASANGSPVDAFAALLAALDPADLQTALSMTSRPVQTNTPAVDFPTAPESFVTSLSAFLMPGAGRSMRPSSEDEEAARATTEKESVPQEWPVDPAAFLVTPIATPLPEPVPHSLPADGFGTSLEDGISSAPCEQERDAPAVVSLPPAEEGAAIEALAIETVAAPMTAPTAKPDAGTSREFSAAALPAEMPAADVVVSRPTVSQQQPAPSETPMAPPVAAAQTPVRIDAAAQASVKNVSSTASTPRPESSSTSTPQPETVSNLENRLMEAVRRVLASPPENIEARPESQVSMVAASARPVDLFQMVLGTADDRVALPTQLGQGTDSNSYNGGNRDQSAASQREFTGTLAVHVPQTISTASTQPVFALPGAAPTDDPLPEDAALARQIVQAAQFQLKSGGGDARLTLHPEYLGEVQISIRVEAGTVTATLHASEPQVRVWMQAHEGLLKQGLAEQGLQLDKLDVRNERNEREEDEASQNRRNPEPQQPRRVLPGTPVFDLAAAQDLDL